MQFIMIIRHAEKPVPNDGVEGVDVDGKPGAENLSVKGWQRAGALVGLLGGPAHGFLPTPARLFAPKVSPASPSRRGAQTLEPLAQRLELSVDTQFEKDDIGPLTQALLNNPRHALLAWEHKMIPALANSLLGTTELSPQQWQDDCYDRIWVITRSGSDKWFRTVNQELLAGDA